MLGVGVAVGESELEAQGVSVGRGRGRGGGAQTVVLHWQEKTGNKRFEVLLFKYECWLGLLIPSKYP